LTVLVLVLVLLPSVTRKRAEVFSESD
jgi:hypothetical protein